MPSFNLIESLNNQKNTNQFKYKSPTRKPFKENLADPLYNPFITESFEEDELNSILNGSSGSDLDCKSLKSEDDSP